jgi:hypothetical protein
MEQATFLLTDPPALVQASLACPMCLYSATWQTAGTGAQPAVDCACTHCGHERTVELSAVQMLRLTLADDDDDDGQLLAAGVPSWRQLFMLL